MRPNWKTLLGLGIVAVLFWWLFRDTDPLEVWAQVRNADFALLLLAVAVTTAGFALRAIRWRLFLAPAHPASPYRSRFAAVCVGFMVNNLLPGRVGELARAYTYSRLEPVPATTAFATLVVERFLDGVAILLLLVVAVLSPSFPAETLPDDLLLGIRVVSAALGIVLIATIILVVFPRPSVRVCGRVADRLLPSKTAAVFATAMHGFVEGLASMRGWRLMIPALAWSLVLWTTQSLSFWIGFFAFGIDLPYAAALLTNAAIAFAVAIPAAPGYVGTFHASAALALSQVYGVADEPALGFAFGWHLGSFFPVTFMGLWYARRLGASLKDFRWRREPGAEAAEAAGRSTAS